MTWSYVAVGVAPTCQTSNGGHETRFGLIANADSAPSRLAAESSTSHSLILLFLLQAFCFQHWPELAFHSLPNHQVAGSFNPFVLRH